MEEWFYIHEDRQVGPVTLRDLKRLIDSREIDSRTPVWTKNLSEWTPADRVESLERSPYAAPSVMIGDPEIPKPYSPQGKQVRPWVRFWARTFDLVLFTSFIGLVDEMAGSFRPLLHDVPLILPMMAAYCFIEPIMLSTIGTTPFKALFNINVRNKDGSKLNYFQGLKRTVKVLVLGQGLLVSPLLSLPILFISHEKLRKTGITFWDKTGGTIVSHREIQLWRLLILFGLSAVIAWMLILETW